MTLTLRAPIVAAAPGVLRARPARSFRAVLPVEAPPFNGHPLRPPRENQWGAIVRDALSPLPQVACPTTGAAKAQVRCSPGRRAQLPWFVASPSREDLRVAPPAARCRPMELAGHHPATLASLGRLRVAWYPPGRARAVLGIASASDPPVAVKQPCLTTVLLAARNVSSIRSRTSWELRSLGFPMDLQLGGPLLSSPHVLVQRFNTLFLAAMQMTWGQARRVVLLPPTGLARWYREEPRESMRDQAMVT